MTYQTQRSGEGLQEWELTGELEGEWSGESDGEWSGEDEWSGESQWSGEDAGESEEELAYELLEITSEEELDQFLGKLVKGAGKFLKSGVGKAVVGALKKVAKVALPTVGAALGSFVAPGLGTAIGGKLGSMASGLLEAEELEMLGEEEAEFEAARRFVQLGRATARYAASAPRQVPPSVVARSATVAAARRYAPALVRPSTPGWRGRRQQRLGSTAGVRAAAGRPRTPARGGGYGSGWQRRPAYGRSAYGRPAWGGVWGGDVWPVTPAWASSDEPWSGAPDLPDWGAPAADDGDLDSGTGFEFA